MDMTPHDRFVRHAFADAAAAADLLRQALPKGILKDLVLSEVHVRSESFVDQDLCEHATDLLVEVPTIPGEQAFIYVLVEHKAEPDPWVMLQLYRYIGQIWRRLHDENSSTRHLPLVVPLVVYHGRREWRQPLDFQSIVEVHSELEAQLVPSFRTLLYDMGTVNAPDLPAGRRFLATIVALQTARDFAPALMRLLVRLLKHAPLSPQWRGFVESVLRYLLQALEPVQQPLLLQEIRRQHFHEGEDRYMTIAESLKEEGIQQGALQDKQQVLIRQLNRKYGTNPEERARIQATTDAEALDRALDAVVDADTKDAVLRELG